MKINTLIFALCFSLFSTQLKAEPLKDFLVSCAYGTVAGALVGVASLAFTDDPGSKMNNIAKGASLGLYAGMGFGLYLVYGANANANISSRSSVWFEPLWQNRGVEVQGLKLNAVAWRF